VKVFQRASPPTKASSWTSEIAWSRSPDAGIKSCGVDPQGDGG
jgi:hypothetical protein